MSETKKKSIVSEELAQKMFEAGIHFGHKKSNWNPKMTPYIFGLKNNIYIIDLEKTMEELEKAINFIKETKENNGKILFVENRTQSQFLVEEIAKKCNMPYVTSRWIGGLMTNFKTIRKRVEHFLDLEKKKAEGELKKYTKKEQQKFDKEIEKLKKRFDGIRNLDKLPNALFITSIKSQMTPVREAKKKNIPVIGLVDTDSDPTIIDYPIPSNDESISALKFMLEQIEEALK
ncbi:MAG: 30S ribosomal protein S2 [Candidatus Portnoybacteria bacterium RBG_13_40_8]|uniref:Small ribosomal subunit protein uS2 n=1 Tax=Candidatus Portnoybacteria bacterium RBG_13_40_8 TaxID=1801990 RepID=A0A1G2F420_9BACT|nr:MAG: 30S ribosomal protein S2 [Candidatus Portnoybacteria bacterium RBG_13_40_8]OGZ34993.1 MAG: 30S ribosomal protein S2 [Candidatus Portnoybacteria bacterium RIFCSPHIGHO2_01_FULL_39_19]